MRQKIDKRTKKAILKTLDALQRKHGAVETKYAVNKWVRTQQDRARIQKRRLALERELAEVNRRLG